MSLTSAADLLELAAEAAEAPRIGERVELADVSTPLFAGFVPAGPQAVPVLVESFDAFCAVFGSGESGPFMDTAALAPAVRGFFRNGGRRCWICRLPGVPGEGELTEIELNEIFASACSIVAVPDVHRLRGGAEVSRGLQQAMVARAESQGGRMVVLDAPPALSPSAVRDWRRSLKIHSPVAVVFYPWLEVTAASPDQSYSVPPSGHAIGTWARVDAVDGVHRSTTGQLVVGAGALACALDANDQRTLNRDGVNCIRAFPGPEARVWGASTLSDDPDWHYLQRRRTYQQLLTSLAFGTDWLRHTELSDASLERLTSSVSGLLLAAWRRGALQGATPGQAFAAECTPSRERPGHVALDLKLALRQPGAFKEARMMLSTASVG